MHAQLPLAAVGRLMSMSQRLGSQVDAIPAQARAEDPAQSRINGSSGGWHVWQDGTEGATHDAVAGQGGWRGEVCGWAQGGTTGGSASLMYFRLKWSASAATGNECFQVEVPAPGGGSALRRQPFWWWRHDTQAEDPPPAGAPLSPTQAHQVQQLLMGETFVENQ